MTGRIGAFSVGAMNALTQAERRHGRRGSQTPPQTVEPFTSYSVVRANREFANQSKVGFMFTATNRRLDDATRPLVASSAYTGGVDFDWRLSRLYKIDGYVAGSTVQGDAEADGRVAAVDAATASSAPTPITSSSTRTRTALRGHAGQVAFSKHGGERVRFNSTGATGRRASRSTTSASWRAPTSITSRTGCSGASIGPTG